MSMFDMDQFMADREASMRRRPLCEEERDAYWGGAPEPDEDEDDDAEWQGEEWEPRLTEFDEEGT